MNPSKFFETQLKELVHDCLYGQLHYRTWRRLNKSFGGEADTMGVAVLFFVSTAEAHLNSCRLHLFRLLDDSKGSLSLKGLIKFAEENKGIFKREAKLNSTIVRHHKILDDLKPTINNLLEHRKKHFIHKSKEYLQRGYDKLYEEYNSTYKDYENVLTNFGEILNDYLELFKDETIIFRFLSENEEFENLKYFIRKGRVKVKEEIDKQIGK